MLREGHFLKGPWNEMLLHLSYFLGANHVPNIKPEPSTRVHIGYLSFLLQKLEVGLGYYFMFWFIYQMKFIYFFFLTLASDCSST